MSGSTVIGQPDCSGAVCLLVCLVDDWAKSMKSNRQISHHSKIYFLPGNLNLHTLILPRLELTSSAIMRLTLRTFFNPTAILRSTQQQSGKDPNVKVNVEQPKSAAPPPKPSSNPPPPRVDVKINPPKQGGVPAGAILLGLVAAGGIGYWYFTNTKKGEQAVVDAKGELEKAKISAKYAGGDALDKAKDVAHDKLDHAKDAAKDGLDKAKGFARDKLDDAKKALK